MKLPSCPPPKPPGQCGQANLRRRNAVRAYLDRIDRLDSRLAAYITVTREEALDAARQVEWRLSGGGDPGALCGVPVAIKDQFWTDGILTSNGSRVYREFVPSEDSTVVRRLKEAGATLLGKLNLSELAMGGTQEPPWGIPANPWDLDRTPGESSSGSGVALSAHLCAASIGEDTGGSGRGPAAYCGVVGLRPTFTRVSRYGMTHMCWFMDAAAPMTKTVEDCAIVLGVIAGYDERDPYTSHRPVPDYTATLRDGVKGLRVGLIRELHQSADMHPEVRDAIEKSLDTLRGLGAEVKEVSIPLVELAGAIFVGVADTEGAGARDEILRTRADELGTRPAEPACCRRRWCLSRSTTALPRPGFCSVGSSWRPLTKSTCWYRPRHPTPLPCIRRLRPASRARRM